MKRRQFLTVLTSGVVGLSLVEIEWIPGQIISTAPLPNTLLKGLEQITPALAREVGALLDFRAQFEPHDYSLGMGGMSDQFSIDCGLDEAEWDAGVDCDAVVLPMATFLAERIRDTGIGRFGALPIPINGVADGLVATDEQSGVTIRGLRAFMMDSTYEVPIYAPGVEEDDEDSVPIGYQTVHVPARWATRFDFIGGPAA